MKELDEVLELLRNAMPLLKKFGEWQKQQELREKEEQERASAAEQEFREWVANKRKREQREAQDAYELQQRFFGGETWKTERFFPKPY